MKHATLKASQIRAARSLLGWSRELLAERAAVSVRTLASIELDDANPRQDTMDAIVDALLKAGVLFIKENGGGVGVRLKRRP